MKKMIVVLALVASCVGPREVRQEGPLGPMPLPSEMAAGRRACARLCRGVAREFLEYRPDGRCVCKPLPAPAPEEQE